MTRLVWISRIVGILLAISATARAQFTPAPGSPFPAGRVPSSVAVGDFNGDGKLDLAIADAYHLSFGVTVLLGDGKGGFTAVPGSPFAVGRLPTSLAVGDFNGDGKLDLAIANSDNDSITVLLGDGRGGFTEAPDSPFGVGRLPFSVAVGDFNGDGKLDLAATNENTNTVTVLLGNGMGGFTAAPGSPFALGAYPTAEYPISVAVGDFNGDGKLDLAIANCGSGTVTVLLGDGMGGFASAPHSPFAAGVNAWSVVVGDFNQDGKLDLAVANHDGGYVTVLLGDGKGGFTASAGSPFPAVSLPGSVTVGDFNGDGKLDLAVANQGDNSLTVLLGNGTGGFTPAPGSPFVVGTTPISLAVGDFSGDGKAEIAVANEYSDSVTVLLSRSTVPPPTLLSPSNGATGVSLTPTLSWDASSGASSYDVYLGTSSQPSLVTNTAGTIYSPGTLTAGATYYWQILAKNSTDAAFSATWSFVVLPAAPVLSSPANAATGVSVTPTLTWAASSGATSYDVYFGASSVPSLVTNTAGTSYATGTLSSGTTYYWQIVARTATGTAASATWSFTTGAPVGALRFVPVTPCRVADTRNPPGPFGGPTMADGSTRSFAIAQSGCGIPITAQAYSLNVTVVPEGPLSYLSLWPAGQSQPFVSTLNSFGGIVVANAAIVPAGTGGAVSVHVSNATDVILDINGYFDSPSAPATSYSFYPATPCRVADTRGATGQFGGPSIGGGQSRDFPIPLSSCGTPATARAYSLNATVVPGGYLGYLTTWPTGVAQPLVSTLNSWTGKIVANAALVPAGTNESISVFVSNPTDVILDINGYFGQPGSPGALFFYPVTPCRVADTRGANGPFGGPEMTAQSTRSFTIPASACGIPATAAAYSMNVTVVPDGVLSYLTAWPTGSSQPLVSTLNSFDGAVVANAAIVPAGTSGAISLFVTNPTHVILDINGYFAP